MPKIGIFGILGIFDPLPDAEKSKFGKIVQSTPRNVPKDARNVKKMGSNAVTH